MSVLTISMASFNTLVSVLTLLLRYTIPFYWKFISCYACCSFWDKSDIRKSLSETSWYRYSMNSINQYIFFVFGHHYLMEVRPFTLTYLCLTLKVSSLCGHLILEAGTFYTHIASIIKEGGVFALSDVPSYFCSTVWYLFLSRIVQ